MPIGVITTDPTDPAVLEAHWPMGAQNYGINFFTENFTEQCVGRHALQ